MNQSPMKHTAEPNSGSPRDNGNAVVEVLNTARSMELHALQQYMVQHYDLSDQDYGLFASAVKRIAVVEMRHAEDLAERIKELGGKPGTVPAGKTLGEQDVREVFGFDGDLEAETIRRYNDFLQVCRENGDNLSAKLFEKLLVEEQEHLNYFRDQAGHIENLGNAYLAEAAGSRTGS